MLREEGIEEIYDGRFYSPDDLVPVGCSGCEGCSDCCRNTGDTIILDPYDMYLLQTGTGRTFEEMIELQIEIRLVDRVRPVYDPSLASRFLPALPHGQIL